MWADREGVCPIPALPETVAAYLAERAANGLSPASLRLDRAAIRYHHSDAGHANPADNEGVRRVLRASARFTVPGRRITMIAGAAWDHGTGFLMVRQFGFQPGPAGQPSTTASDPKRGAAGARASVCPEPGSAGIFGGLKPENPCRMTPRGPILGSGGPIFPPGKPDHTESSPTVGLGE